MTADSDLPVCVVVGAGPGNGRALAARFAAAGYRVVLMARRHEPLRTLAAQIDGGHAVAADAADPAAVSEAFDRVRDQFGPVRTLLYNAGASVFGDLDAISAADFARAWETNALGLLHCAKAVVPDMRGRAAGEIVVSGATASKKGGAGFAAFAAAKAAQYSLAQSMARQLGPEGIHVAIAIIDGVIASDRTRRMLPDRDAEDFMAADDIAEAIYQVVRQPRSAWTFELDLRPFRERW